MIQVIVFVPSEHKEKVKMAMFNAGAGRMGNYDSCSFEHMGIGQFRPLPGSKAFIGKVNEIEIVEEVRIEMVCEDEAYSQVIAAIKSSHPYETPAYYGIKTLR